MEEEHEQDGIDFCELPNSMTGHRSCLRCGLVKTFTQFYDNGCENCPFLELEGRQDRVERCTTSNFEGCGSLLATAPANATTRQAILHAQAGGLVACEVGEP